MYEIYKSIRYLCLFGCTHLGSGENTLGQFFFFFFLKQCGEVDGSVRAFESVFGITADIKLTPTWTDVSLKKKKESKLL